MKRAFLLATVLALVAACAGDPELDSGTSLLTSTSSTAATSLSTAPERQTTTTSLPPEPATLLFRGGPVLTMDPANPTAKAVAVSGNQLAAVGTESDLAPLIGENTRVVDLEGRALLPGFVDAHSHYYGSLLENGIDAVQSEILAAGVTTVGEAGVSPDLLEELTDLESRGQLLVRTSLYLLHDDACGDETGDWALDVAPQRDPGRRLHVGGVKVFADGGSCNAPAVSYEHGFGGHGDLYYSADQVADIVSRYDGAGFQVAVHALGDRAVDNVLDGLDTVITGSNPLRHRIEHNAVVPPALRGRYDQVGAVPVIFGSFGTCAYLGLDDRFRFRTPIENQEWEWPWRDLLDHNPGTVFAWHGDYPVFARSTPIVGLGGFVTRYQELDDGTVCEPEPYHFKHAITVDEALHLMTTGAAYALHREQEVGSIEVGKLADLVVLSADPHTTAPRDLFDLEVQLVVLDGEPEHCHEVFTALCGDMEATSEVHASSSLAAHPPGHAVDGDPDTHWGAGADAPQWIEIPLDGELAVTGIRLVVDQYPPGPTLHVISGRLANGDLVELARLAGETDMFDELVVEADGPWVVTAIRIETVDSPSWVSWREIDVVVDD